MSIDKIAIVGIGSLMCYFAIDMTYNSLSFNSFAWKTLTEINSKILASEESIRDMKGTFESIKSYRNPNSYEFSNNIKSDTDSLIQKLQTVENSSISLENELKSIKSDMKELKNLLEKSLQRDKHSKYT